MGVAPRRLTAATIERRAAILLIEYQTKFGRIYEPPVPVEEILEGFLRLHLEFDDLRTGFGLEGVLGATIRETRRVFIDEQLDPVEHPEREGRYRFTIAHEIGHWRLHQQVSDLHALGCSQAPNRVGGYPEFEWQADKFASYLLMPTFLVRREWAAVYGSPDPAAISPEVLAAGIANIGTRAGFIEEFASQKAEPLAERFKVSRPAMRIRLQELGLLPRP